MNTRPLSEAQVKQFQDDGYLIRRLAERPANLTFFARSLITKD